MKLRFATASAHSTPSGAKYAEPGQPVGSFAELHHQRFARLLEQAVGEVRRLNALNDLVHTTEPSLDMQQLLGRLEAPSKQHGFTADVVIQPRVQAAVVDEVDLTTEDPLEQLLEPDKTERRRPLRRLDE